MMIAQLRVEAKSLTADLCLYYGAMISCIILWSDSRFILLFCRRIDISELS